jgi:hypothetical protein
VAHQDISLAVEIKVNADGKGHHNAQKAPMPIKWTIASDANQMDHSESMLGTSKSSTDYSIPVEE